ncbi:MAG: DegT/DnrJ/EryC1/StrS family aminotransferase [Spirochaetes bacterium]|nr:DegT/DnrJ/EryC1/StrS family aminotransferase [Spirochaetota bacterium]
MKIPFHKPYIDDAEINSMSGSVRNGWLTMGKKTYEFENDFKSFIGASDAVAVNSCTAALHLALKCSGIKEGDEVLMPATTHSSTSEAVMYFKAKPVFIDIERDTHLIDVEKIEQKITRNTKAVIPVHFSGQPADMDRIIDIARKYDLSIIEDAAHAFPAMYKGRFVGTIGDATCFSFYATKTITTGEGGMISTENREWAERMRLLRLHGVSRDAWERETAENFWEYDVVELGFKYNTTDLASAIGLEQLKKADAMHKMRSAIAAHYNDAFRQCEGILLYIIRDERETAWHLYPLRLNLERLTIDRNAFILELKKLGITASVHFIPLYRFTFYKKLGYYIGDYPESEWVFSRVISLPIFPGMTSEETNYVIGAVLDIVKKFKR